MLARPISILHHCVPQHATQECVSTPMTAFKTRIRRCETSPDFATETELAASEPCALYPRGPSQAILRSLKSHSQITASVTPATHSKRPYRNRPGRETAPNLASTTGAVPIGIYRLPEPPPGGTGWSSGNRAENPRRRVLDIDPPWDQPVHCTGTLQPRKVGP